MKTTTTAATLAGRKRPGSTRQPGANPAPARAVAGAVRPAWWCACGGGCPRCSAKVGAPSRLRIAAADDAREREADRLADRAVAAPLRAGIGANTAPTAYGSRAATGPAAPASVDRVLAASGRPLEPAVRQDMEQRLGHDFSNVRVHTGGAAERSAEDIDANAYAVGRDIVFGAGRFSTATREGRRLLAHELTHVAQHEGPGGRLEARAVDARQARSPAGRAGPTAPQALHRDRRKGGERSKKAGPTVEPSRAPRVSWEDALATLDAITSMLPRVQDHGIVLPSFGAPGKGGLEATLASVPAKYKDLVREWDFIVHPTRAAARGATISIYGTMRETHLNQAVAETQPLVNELATEGQASSTDPFLAGYWQSIARLREEIAEEVVDESAERAKTIQGAGFDALSEEERVKTLLEKATEALHLATKVVTQFSEHAIEHAIEETEHLHKMQELDELFHEAAKKAGEIPRGGVLEAASKMSVAAALVHLEGGLHGLSAILALSDPAQREEMFRARKDIFGKAAMVTQGAKLALQLVAGVTALTGASTYALAKLLGKEGLATTALAKAVPLLEKLDLAISGVMVVHGILTLLDSDATGEEKEEAVLEIGIGSATILARLTAAFRGGPATLSVVISFFTLKALAHAAVNFSVDLVKISLNQCYAYMRGAATDINDNALRLAIAIQLSTYEPDPHRAALFKGTAVTLRARLSWELAQAKRRALVEAGARDKDPASHDPLRRRFLPIEKMPVRTDIELLNLAREYVHIVAEALAHPQEILDEEVEYVWEHYG
jgi:ribosomal protein L17